jgi:hypothetical protein
MSDHVQGTTEWHADRCGKITASRITDVLTKPIKGKQESTTRRNYRAELVCERLTGKVPESFQTWEMKRGTELEPFARTEYELRRSVEIQNVGFIVHPRFPFAGGSPDGLIGLDGMVQFKCPKTAIHLDWLMAGIVPMEHRAQMHWEMAVTGRKWNDFVSFDPNLPEHLQLFVKRFDRDEVAIAEIEQEVLKFNAEIEAIIGSLPNADAFSEVAEGLAV